MASWWNLGSRRTSSTGHRTRAPPSTSPAATAELSTSNSLTPGRPNISNTENSSKLRGHLHFILEPKPLSLITEHLPRTVRKPSCPSPSRPSQRHTRWSGSKNRKGSFGSSCRLGNPRCAPSAGKSRTLGILDPPVDWQTSPTLAQPTQVSVFATGLSTQSILRANSRSSGGPRRIRCQPTIKHVRQNCGGATFHLFATRDKTATETKLRRRDRACPLPCILIALSRCVRRV